MQMHMRLWCGERTTKISSGGIVSKSCDMVGQILYGEVIQVAENHFSVR